MNQIQKTFLYPLVSTAIIIVISLLNWVLTLFFALLFDTTIHKVTNSPMIIIYIVSFVVTIYSIVNVCQYIQNKE